MGLKALLVAVMVLVALSGLAECAPAEDEMVKSALEDVLVQARDLAEEYAAKTRELPGIKHTIDIFQMGINLVEPYARIFQDQMIHMWKQN